MFRFVYIFTSFVLWTSFVIFTVDAFTTRKIMKPVGYGSVLWISAMIATERAFEGEDDESEA